MTHQNPDALVSTDWLSRYIEAVEIRIVYVSIRSLGAENRVWEEFEKRHIPYAVYFDLSRLFDSPSELMRMLPSPEIFSEIAMGIAIGNGTRIVIYDDGDGSGASFYLWWLFRLFGHDDVAVVDGGMRKWLSDKLELSNHPRKPNPHNFTPLLNDDLIRSSSNSNNTNGFQLINCGLSAFLDCDDEAAKEVGNTSALKISSMLLFSGSSEYEMLPISELKDLYGGNGVDLDVPLLLFGPSLPAVAVHVNALFLMGREDVPVLVTEKAA